MGIGRITTEHLQQLVSQLPEAAFVSNLDGIIRAWNEPARQLFGYRKSEIVGMGTSQLGPAQAARETRRKLAAVAAGEPVAQYQSWSVGISGEIFPASLTVSPLTDQDGNVEHALWIVRDITEIRRLESVIWEEKERAETTYGLISEAVIMTDVEGLVMYLNPVAEHLTGWMTVRAHGRPASEVVRLVHAETQEPARLPLERALLESAPVEPGQQNMLILSDGSMIPIEDTASPVRDREGMVCGAVMILRETGERRGSRLPNAYVPGIDQVTGLLSQREFESRIERALVSAASENTSHVLVAIDIQGFDQFRDTYGSAAGDEMLRQIAALIRTQIRDLDVAARYEQDEFLVLLTHCPLSQGERLAEQIQRTFSDFPFRWRDEGHQLVGQFGVIPVTADSGAVSRIIEIARVVCQSAEYDGVDFIQALDVGDINRMLSSRRWDRSQMISRALEENRLQLFGQRIKSLSTDDERGEMVEILVHMLDDNEEIVSPSVFLPTARRAGLMLEVDRWVVKSLFTMLRNEGKPGVALWTVNLSIESISDERFPGFVIEQAREQGISGRRICFEVHETVATANLGDLKRLIEALAPEGFQFCLTRFGGSPNSYAYLRNLNVQFVKIDGSLTRDVADDSVDRAIVRGITGVCHSIGKQTIAEFVEDITTLDLLRTLDLDFVQGYAIAEPLPIPQVT